MSKIQYTQTDLAPKAIGPYSQATSFNKIHFFSGQIGLDAKTGEMKNGFQEQLNQVMNNIDGLLKANSLERKNVIKSTIFLKDLSQFAAINAAYEKFFTPPYPARSTIEVSKLPKDGLVEIEIIAAEF